jgi:hypothetical protein
MRSHGPYRTSEVRKNCYVQFEKAVIGGVCAGSREFQARAAEELKSMPSASAIAEMLSDYAVLRDQARSC